MFGIGFFELIFIAIVALVVVGPKRLPEVMKQAGRLFVHLRRTANDVRSSFEQVVREAEDEMRREEAESIRQALKPVGDVRQEIQGLLNDTHHEHPTTAADVPAAAAPAEAASASTDASAVSGEVSTPPPASTVAVPPEHQPSGSQTFNPNGPGPLHKS